ncbi:hypothetical protein HU200_009633 [Digitaria exilis]|nr:hypothetical protein HU200_009633 [Digitaria exilis]
MLGDLES